MEDLKPYAIAIDHELKELHTKLLERFNENMSRYGIDGPTGALKNATTITQNQVADDLVGGLDIVTLKYGVTLQSSKRFVVKAPIENIIEWIRAIGLARFKANPHRYPTEDANIRALAWGIKQHGRAKKQGADSLIKSGRRVSDPWLYRDFYGYVAAFQESLAEKTNPELAKGIANAIRRQLVQKS